MNNEEIKKKYNLEDYHGRCDKNECFTCDISLILDEARADERANFLTKHPHDYAYQLGREDGTKEERARLQVGDLTKAGQSLYNRRRDIEQNKAKEIFKELDSLCSDTGIGFGLDLEDSLSNHARDSEKFRKAFMDFKKTMGV